MCFAASFLALSEGLEGCLWQIGGVPQWHRTDNLSAAVRDLDREGQHEFTQNYQALLAHYGMQPSANSAGLAHQNGDVEQSHFRFKQAVDQALRVRGSRDFVDRGAYERFLAELVRQRNLTRASSALKRSEQPCARCRQRRWTSPASSRLGCRVSAWSGCCSITTRCPRV